MRMALSAAALLFSLSLATAQPPKGPTGEPRQVFFCFWNVENLFDDKDDKRNSTDEIYDNPFAKNKDLRQLKLDRLAEALLKMNDGRGPDILACVEVESIRAAELLMGTLNARMKDPKDKYKHILMKNLDAGRHIAPCVITRLDVSNLSTKLHGGNLRILETHIFANGYDLCILATHWTSQLRQSDGGDGDAGREKYARTAYGVFEKITINNPSTDFLVCGDFNDTPDARPIVQGLHATGNRGAVTPMDRGASLLDLMAGKDPLKYGTIWFQGKPLIYDHICISPGLLDKTGWGCEVDSVKTVTDGLIRKGATRREPWRFGDPDRNLSETERGYSDHFPVTVMLNVAGRRSGK